MGDTTTGECGLSAARIVEEEYNIAQGGVWILTLEEREKNAQNRKNLDQL